MSRKETGCHRKLPLSVIVPVYNVGPYIEDCIKSILSQTFDNFELILVDDGSTDNSGCICDMYAERDCRVRVIHKENGGLSSARNAGIDACQGRFIGFVDGDDCISRTMYEHLYNAAKESNADIAVSKYLEVFDIPETEFDSCQNGCWNTNELLKNFFLRQVTESVCDKIFSARLWSDIRFPHGEINEDTVTLFTVLMKCERAAFINTQEYFYRVRRGSITKSGYSSQFAIVEKHLNRIRKIIEVKRPELILYVDYFRSIHLYCLLFSILDTDSWERFKRDYIRYRKEFRRVFRVFLIWGTGRSKDKLNALLLCMPFSEILHFLRR